MGLVAEACCGLSRLQKKDLHVHVYPPLRVSAALAAIICHVEVAPAVLLPRSRHDELGATPWIVRIARMLAATT